jgi:hypothetical protein
VYYKGVMMSPVVSMFVFGSIASSVQYGSRMLALASISLIAAINGPCPGNQPVSNAFARCMLRNRSAAPSNTAPEKVMI